MPTAFRAASLPGLMSNPFMSDPDVPPTLAAPLLAIIALMGVGLFVLFLFSAHNPDPLHATGRSSLWREPIQQEANPDALRVPPPQLKPLQLPPRLSTRPATLPATRPTTQSSPQ